MNRPKKGQRITAAWASELQSRNEMPVSPGMQRTSGGFILSQRSHQPPAEIAIGLDDEVLLPYSLVCLKPTTSTVDGSITYQATKLEVTRWIVSTGEQTVPINGKFTPVWPVYGTPMQLRTNPEDENWRVGSTIGRKKEDTYCASAGFGFICLTTPVNNLVWAQWAPGPTWAVSIGSVPGTTTPTTELVENGKLAWVRLTGLNLEDIEVSDMREDYCRRDNGTTLTDGTLIQVDLVGMKLVAVWANCAPTAALAGLTP